MSTDAPSATNDPPVPGSISDLRDLITRAIEAPDSQGLHRNVWIAGLTMKITDSAWLAVHDAAIRAEALEALANEESDWARRAWAPEEAETVSKIRKAILNRAARYRTEAETVSEMRKAILSRGVQEATEWAESAVTIAENEMTRQHRDRYLAALGCVCLLDITHGHNNSLDWHACHRCTNTWPQNSVRPVCLSNLTDTTTGHNRDAMIPDYPTTPYQKEAGA